MRAHTRSPGAAYGTNTTSPSWCASASKPKVSRSTSSVKSASIKAELAEHEQHLLGGVDAARDPAEELLLDDAARRHLHPVRHDVEEPRAEEDGRALDGLDRAADAQHRRAVAGARDEHVVRHLHLRRAPEALLTGTREVRDLREPARHLAARKAHRAGRDRPVLRVRARERDPFVGQDVEDRRPQRLVRDLDEPTLLTADGLGRIELAPYAAAERDRDRERRERDPHQSFANMRFTCENVEACAVAIGAFAARGR